MIALDRTALICDLAETYGILDYKALPIETLAVLSIGLRENSRIKMKLSGARVQPDSLLLAAAVDRLSLLVWSKTKDAEKGINKPKSLVGILSGEEKTSDILAFDTAEEWEAEKRRIIGGM
ncbi:MAG: DUF5361 domain-containing protein [Lachnospiraceae bacterium]|nr:DUF5361 domain-containing protein [Lachnospiraceae bacterium]